jgi:hypothetical protein
MMTMRKCIYLPVLVVIFFLLFNSVHLFNLKKNNPFAANYGYEPVSACRDCHQKLYRQYSESTHAQSFENPVFQAVYSNYFQKGTSGDEGRSEEAEKCLACHSPVLFMTKKDAVITKEEIDPRYKGITCDFCHTITDLKDRRPGNANYVSTPGVDKYGPYRQKRAFHRFYSRLHRSSKFCGMCHDAVNNQNVRVKSTYREWRESPYAKKGIRCQYCHMSIPGYLIDGKPVFESGRASEMVIGSVPIRSRIYSHSFPGSSIEKQVKGAVTLKLASEKPEAFPGEEMLVNVLVRNARAGHKVPTGCTELRLLWLELFAEQDNRVVSVPADTECAQDIYDVSGKETFDPEVLGNDIPEGSRIYRTVYVDKTGNQTLIPCDASEILFDNRLNPRETRTEIYRLRLPEDMTGTVLLTARMYYLSYPSSFAEQNNILKPEPVEVASAQMEVNVHPNNITVK